MDYAGRGTLKQFAMTKGTPTFDKFELNKQHLNMLEYCDVALEYSQGLRAKDPGICTFEAALTFVPRR